MGLVRFIHWSEIFVRNCSNADGPSLMFFSTLLRLVLVEQMQMMVAAEVDGVIEATN